MQIEYKKEWMDTYLWVLPDGQAEGPYIEKMKDVRLKFRGSSNQRIIDVQKTIETGECVLYLE